MLDGTNDITNVHESRVAMHRTYECLSTHLGLERLKPDKPDRGLSAHHYTLDLQLLYIHTHIFPHHSGSLRRSPRRSEPSALAAKRWTHTKKASTTSTLLCLL